MAVKGQRLAVIDHWPALNCCAAICIFFHCYHIIKLMLLVPEFQNGKTKWLSNDLDENLKYDPWKSTGDILLYSSFDPDLNFYNINIKNINTPYILLKNVPTFLDNSLSESFSVFRWNIRSMNKKLENFKDILTGLKYNLSIIYYLLLWDYELCNQDYELPNHKNVYQIRNHSRGVGASIYINKNFRFKIRHDLNINCKDLESISV